jgi:FkbM family methyltransferase
MQQQIKPECVVDVGVGKLPYLKFWTEFYGRAIGFEPYRDHYEKMYNSIEYQGFEDVEIYPYAIGRTNKNVTFFCNVKEPFYSTTSQTRIDSLKSKHLYDQDDWESTVVEMKTLDDFFANRSEKIALIKSDSEANELDVLIGAQETIEKHRPLLQLEHLQHAISTSEVADFLNHIKYKQVKPYFDINQFYFTPMEWKS